SHPLEHRLASLHYPRALSILLPHRNERQTRYASGCSSCAEVTFGKEFGICRCPATRASGARNKIFVDGSNPIEETAEGRVTESRASLGRGGDRGKWGGWQRRRRREEREIADVERCWRHG